MTIFILLGGLYIAFALIGAFATVQSAWWFNVLVVFTVAALCGWLIRWFEEGMK